MSEWTVICRVEDIPRLGARKVAIRQPALAQGRNGHGAPDLFGRRVEVTFEKLTDEITLPQFRLAR